MAEFLGTLLLVLFVTLVVSLYVTSGSATDPSPYVDFGVIGLLHVFILFVLIQGLAIVSGAHFNPAVTTALAFLRQIRPADAGVYIVCQLAGGVVGVLITKLLLSDFGNADDVDFGAVGLSDRLDGSNLLGMLGEGIGTFILMFAIIGVAVNPLGLKDWAGFAIGSAPVSAGARLRRVRRSRHLPAGLRARAGDRRAARRGGLRGHVARAGQERPAGRRARRLARSVHLVEVPLTRDAAELVGSAVPEVDARPHDEVLDGAGDQHLARRGLVEHAGADVDGEPADVVADHLALARVESGADLDAELTHGPLDRLGRAYRPGRPVERRQDAGARAATATPSRPSRRRARWTRRCR
jgi:glycerol uptake facilitator-like aquaporin